MGKLIYALGAVVLLQLYTIDSAPLFPSTSPSFSGFMPFPVGMSPFDLPFLSPLLSVIPLLSQLPPYVLKMVIHNNNVFVYPSKRLCPGELGYLAYLFHKQNISSFYVVYNYVSLDTPITISKEELPPCTADACPISADKISKPTAKPPTGPPDTAFIPPNANIIPSPLSPTSPISSLPPVLPPQMPLAGPQGPVFPTPPPASIGSPLVVPPPIANSAVGNTFNPFNPQSPPLSPVGNTFNPFNPQLPSPSPVLPASPSLPQGPTPAVIPTVPVPAVPATPESQPEPASGLKLSVFAKKLVPMILAADYRGVRKIVDAEFTSGMLKLQTDLARLKIRKQTVVDKTSAEDEKADDLAYLDGIVGDAEKVLVDKYNDRRQLFLKDINRMTVEPAFKNISQREAEFVADRFDRIAHDPIAESKKILNSSRKDINDKMAV